MLRLIHDGQIGVTLTKYILSLMLDIPGLLMLPGYTR